MAQIAEESIERVAAANDIVEVIGQYFPLKRAGASWRALCPFHREKSPSFHVSQHKQAYYCFGCGAGGGVFKFVMEYERVDFVTAVRRLAQRSGIELLEGDRSPEDGQRRRMRDRLLEIHILAAKWFAGNLFRLPEGEGAREYLKGREISSDIAKAWQLGYAPDRANGLAEKARKEGFSEREMRECGLFYGDRRGEMRDRFRQRLMFPICNDHGEIIAFSGRVLPPSEDPAKYVNSPETPIFSKGRALYGLHKARRPLADSRVAIICEGQLDLIRIHESGLQNVVAPQGTAFTPEHARLLKRYVDTVVLCFDSDEAGRKAVERAVPVLLSAGLGIRVGVMRKGDDPDSMIRRDGVGAFEELIGKAEDYFDFSAKEAVASGAMNSAMEKAALLRKLAGFAAFLPDAVAKESLAARIGPQFGVLPRAFLSAMPKKVRLDYEETEEIETAESPKEMPDAGMRLLIHSVLVSKEARLWLGEQDIVGIFGNCVGMRMLECCVAATFDVADPIATQAFIATLEPWEQSFLTRLLLDRLPTNPLVSVRDTVESAERGKLIAERDALKARLHEPGISVEVVIDLQKKVIDITKRLSYTARSQ